LASSSIRESVREIGFHKVADQDDVDLLAVVLFAGLDDVDAAGVAQRPTIPSNRSGGHSMSTRRGCAREA